MNVSKVLIVSVHPDDETLGCGGTIFYHKTKGDHVYCLYLTGGNKKQEKQINQLKEFYSFKEIYSLNFPDKELDDISLNELIPQVSGVFREVQPSIVYLPNRSDPHSDHRRCFAACQTCIKSFRYPYVKKTLMMDVISETDFAPALPENIFIPHVFVDISPFMEKKLKALSFYKSELLDFPNTRSIDSITAYNRYRGSQISAAYAECFMLLKEIID